MRNIAVNYCTTHNMFHLQFGVGYFFLCQHQMTSLLHSIIETETETFRQSYISKINALQIHQGAEGYPDVQISFGKLVVRMTKRELLFFLTLLWKNFDQLMDQVASRFFEEPPKLVLL